MIIRRARIEDSTSIARVHVDSWRSTYAGLLPEDMLLRLSSTKHEARWWQQVLGRIRRRHYIYVAEDEADGVVGFISGGPSRDRELDQQGEIYALYLLDEYHGAGAGKALFFRLAQKLRRECGGSLSVWVLAGNPSRFFYEAIGGKRIAIRTERLGDEDVQEIAYGWGDVDELVAPSRPDQA
jgi:GNAT superfamily N-acetyltransferase